MERGDFLGWFEALYASAGGSTDAIPWADMEPNPALVRRLDEKGTVGIERRALVVACGLGDDAEELTRRGFAVTAFDISQTAIEWCRRRFPNSSVKYMAKDLLEPPPAWFRSFDFVFEACTLQSLPPGLRRGAIRAISGFIAPGGTLLVVSRGREPNEPANKMPWPLTRAELSGFQALGLEEIAFDDYMDDERPPVRRFCAEYRVPRTA